jgi:HSP20 family protein
MLTLWNPIAGFDRSARELDRWFGEARNRMTPAFSPEVDIEEHEDRFVIRADLPGVDEADVEVRVHEGTLVLSGKREQAKEEQNERGYYRERCAGSFCRSFRLGTAVDAEKIEAKLDKGVLQVVLPKKEQAKPRVIPVTGN